MNYQILQANVTNGGSSGASATPESLVPIIILLCVITIGVALLMYLPVMKRLSKFFSFMGKTVVYALKGGLTVVAVGVPSYFLYTTSQAGLIPWVEVLKWVGIGIGAFFALAGLGYCMDRIAKRIKKNWKISKEGVKNN